MNVTKEAKDKVQVELTIEVDQADFDKALDEAFKENAKSISIPGFRKGKVPRKIIENNYGKDVFYGDAAEKLVFAEYIKAVQADESVKPIGKPEFDIVQLEFGKPFIFKAIVDTKQDITLGEYRGIEVTEIDTEVTDKEIDEYLTHMREKHALVDVVTDADAVIENGDVVTFDFLGKKDGVAFPGGEAQDYVLTIGSGQFIPGFEEQMVGLKLGEEKDLNLTFPSEYHEPSLAGADVVFEVKINGISRKQLAELDDEFAKDVSEFDTLDEYKADIKRDLGEQKANAISDKYKNFVAEKVVEDSDVVAPSSLVQAESDNYLNDIAFNMRQQGIELEQYLSMTGGSMDDVRKECDERATTFVKQRLVLEAIAEKEDIDVSEEELEKEYAKLAKMYNQPVESVKQVFMMQGQGTVVRRNALLEKVVDFLLKEAKIG